MTRRLTLLLAGSAVLGLLLGLARGPGEAAGGLDAGAGDWTLPAGKDLLRHEAADLAPSLALPWKGRDGRAGAAGKAAPAWRLLGIVYDPQPTALVDEGQGKILRLRAGDALADGSKVLAIESNRVRLERDGCETERRLHAAPDQGPAAGPNDCPAQ